MSRPIRVCIVCIAAGSKSERPKKKAPVWPGLRVRRKLLAQYTKVKSAKCSVGSCFGAFHHFERIDLELAASATRAWLVGIAAHPATQATMKAAAVTANNVLAI